MKRVTEHPKLLIFLCAAALALITALVACDSRDETPIAAATATVQASNDMQLAGEFVQAQSGVFYCQKNESAAGFDLICQAVDPTAEPTGGATEEPTEEATGAPAPENTPTIAASATATTRSRTPTPTAGLPTTEPTALPSPTAVMTGTVEATSTPGATATTPPTTGHDTTAWHPPMDFHHHGANPDNLHPAIVEWMNTHEYGALFRQIGHPWASSPTENIFPYPNGKHEGWKLLAENDTGCDRFNPGGSFPNERCIKAYALWQHDLATAHEARAHTHSWKGVFLICDEQTGTQCGIVASGGWTHFGELHNTYKRDVCLVAGNPVYPPSLTAEQPPYASFRGSQATFLFWSSITNSVILPYFDPDPNRLLEMAFMTGQWSATSRDLNECAFPEFDIEFCPDGSCEQNATRFQVFTLLLDIESYSRPYLGFVNRQGVDNPSCFEIDVDCIPLVIGANVPPGDASLNRPVRNLDPSIGGYMDFDPNNTADLRMPGHHSGE